jgi:hypothetical protein
VFPFRGEPHAVVTDNDVVVTNAPVSHRFAISPHRVVVHRLPQPGPNPSVALPPVPITGATTVVRDAVVSSQVLRYAVVVVDPLGRSTSPVYAQ